jgi:hypothetical protein
MKEGTTSGMAPGKVKARHYSTVDAKEMKPRAKEAGGGGAAREPKDWF